MHTVPLSNRAAQDLIDSGTIRINGVVVTENVLLDGREEIKVMEVIYRPAFTGRYFLFYKPRGYISSLNPDVEDNIARFFPDSDQLAIAGRLDKDSEGLLLLSNDGLWIQRICDPEQNKEKEYLVELDREPSGKFDEIFSAGLVLGDGPTRPCTCESTGGRHVRIVLTEGRNRQIRRMCDKMGYKVVTLKRIRIHTWSLPPDLMPGEIRSLAGLHFLTT